MLCCKTRIENYRNQDVFCLNETLLSKFTVKFYFRVIRKIILLLRKEIDDLNRKSYCIVMELFFIFVSLKILNFLEN